MFFSTPTITISPIPACYVHARLIFSGLPASCAWPDRGADLVFYRAQPRFASRRALLARWLAPGARRPGVPSSLGAVDDEVDVAIPAGRARFGPGPAPSRWRPAQCRLRAPRGPGQCPGLPTSGDGACRTEVHDGFAKHRLGKHRPRSPHLGRGAASSSSGGTSPTAGRRVRATGVGEAGTRPSPEGNACRRRRSTTARAAAQAHALPPPPPGARATHARPRSRARPEPVRHRAPPPAMAAMAAPGAAVRPLGAPRSRAPRGTRPRAAWPSRPAAHAAAAPPPRPFGDLPRCRARAPPDAS